MKVNMRYCTIAAIIAVVLFSVTIGLLMNSGQASYTKSPETWYWTTVQNVTYVVVTGTWSLASATGMDEGVGLTINGEGSVLVPIYATNPNPTLVLKVFTNSDGGFMTLHTDGRVGFKQIANVSLYSATNIYNVTTRVSTNLSRGYSTLNITSEANGSQNDIYIQAMWLE